MQFSCDVHAKEVDGVSVRQDSAGDGSSATISIVIYFKILIIIIIYLLLNNIFLVFFCLIWMWL